MAARVASVSGKWSSTATWGGSAVPVNADTFTINSGVDVEMDADTSGFAAGLGASTINGTLHFSRTAGTYVLKMNAILTVSTTGTLDASDGSGGAYPSTCTATVLFNGAFSITVSGSGIINLICGEPATKYVTLTQIEAINSTTLHVNTDVSAQALWAGAIIRIDNINQAVQSEERTVSGTPSSTVITITAGLTAAKALGTYVTLITRNVKVLGAANGVGINSGTGGVIGAEVRNFGTGYQTVLTATIGGTISTCTSGLSGCNNDTVNAMISGCTNGNNTGQANIFNGLISGCTTAINLGGSCTLTSNAVISGCTNGFGTAASALILGSVLNCTTGLSTGSDYKLSNATLNNNLRDMNNVNRGQAFNTLFGSGTEFLSYNAVTRTAYDCFESFDHDQVSAAYRNWCRGGITSSNTSTVYGTRTRSYQHALELGVAGSYSFRDQTVLVPAGGWVNVNCFIQKDASMGYLPNLQIFPASVEPLISGSASATATMTNSISTWEVLFAKYQNTSTAPQLVKVRVIGQNASGNLYEDCDISVSPFGFALGSAA